MKRLLALLLLPLLLFAQSAGALSAWCVEEAARCVEMRSGAAAGGCCDPVAACPCEAAPAREDAPPSPAPPLPGGRGMEFAALVAAKFAVADVAFAERRSAAVPGREPVRVATPLRRTVLHCSFLI